VLLDFLNKVPERFFTRGKTFAVTIRFSKPHLLHQHCLQDKAVFVSQQKDIFEEPYGTHKGK